MGDLSGFELIVGVIVAIWGIWQTFVTFRLNQQVHRLTIQLDQSIKNLYRLRDLVNQLHTGIMFPEKAPSKSTMVIMTEAMALCKVVGDKELQNYMGTMESALDKFIDKLLDDQTYDHAEFSYTLVDVYKRIYELIEITTMGVS